MSNFPYYSQAESGEDFLSAKKPRRRATREEILLQIEKEPELKVKFETLTKEFQERFIGFCTGAKGLPLTYDPFFKAVFNPEIYPDRLSGFLSKILGIPVKVVAVLVNEGSRILEEGSLLIMDIVVKLQDGSIANVEIQKIPYRFPGQRAACYSSDLIMRQYTRAKEEKRERFTYDTMQKVYTIVLLEKSSRCFHDFKDCFIHRASQKTNTGLRLELLQEYVFISLDMFRKIKQNKVEEELDAWLHCIASQEPDIIAGILEKYPQFASIYADIENFRRDVKGVLNMFSEALKIIDRNTVQFMVDEMQEEIQQMTEELEGIKETLEGTKETLEGTKETLEGTKEELRKKSKLLEEKEAYIRQLEEKLKQ